MAEPFQFLGANSVFRAPVGREDVSDLHAFTNGKAIVSAWKLTPEELEDVIRTGTVFVSSFSGQVLFPIFVGSEEAVRRLVADYGQVWQRPEPAPAGPKCFVPTCSSRGEIFPVIEFAPADWPDDQPFPYRLEIPRLVCEAHAEGFDPKLYFTPKARQSMREMIASNGRPEPVFGHLRTEWRPATDPTYAELAATGQARLWWG